MAQSIKTPDDQSKSKYCCVTCGTSADELAHSYKEGVIKIIHCVRENKKFSKPNFFFSIKL
jgi:hypothetical protein